MFRRRGRSPLGGRGVLVGAPGAAVSVGGAVLVGRAVFVGGRVLVGGRVGAGVRVRVAVAVLVGVKSHREGERGQERPRRRDGGRFCERFREGRRAGELSGRGGHQKAPIGTVALASTSPISAGWAMNRGTPCAGMNVVWGGGPASPLVRSPALARLPWTEQFESSRAGKEDQTPHAAPDGWKRGPDRISCLHYPADRCDHA